MAKKLDDNPRALAQITLCVALGVWQAVPVIFAGVLYGLLVKLFRMDWKLLTGGCFVIGIISLFIYSIHVNLNYDDFYHYGWQLNAQSIRLLFGGDYIDLLASYFDQFSWIYLVVVPAFSLPVFQLFDLIPNGSSYEEQLRELQRGGARRDNFASFHTHKPISAPISAGKFLHAINPFKRSNSMSPISVIHPVDQNKLDKVTKSLDNLEDRDYEGVLLGLPANSNKPCVMPDSHVNQLALVLGTTGSGKTVTLQRFYRRAMTANYPLIIVDGKPSDESTTWIRQYTENTTSKPFYGFNCENFWHYDPLAKGGYTELKDKIISLKDEWESDYYRSIAEDYLQTTFEILQASGQPYNLKRVVECLDFGVLASIVRKLKNPELEARAERIGMYERKDIMGLQAHLNLLIHSELGQYFEHKEEQTFDLAEAIKANAVVYFALPALRFPSFSKVLGKLIINDIKAVIDRINYPRPIFTVFDEFSVFAGDQVLNLVNMGRGKGVHAVFGTQGISDLKRVDSEFANQVLNCVNTIICHRLNDNDSAESVAAWAGTRDTFDVTAQIGGAGSTGMGSVRRNKEFIIHPDVIKQSLQTGEAIYLTKVGQFRAEKIKVKLS